MSERKNIVVKFMCYLMILIITTAVVFLDVNAQFETWVFVEPQNVSMLKGESVQITIDIVDGVDLNAFDLTLLYDSNVVALENWMDGAYFSNLAFVLQQSEPGMLRLAATQVGVPAVSGDGKLLTLVFRGLEPGYSEIMIDRVELVNSANELVIPVIQNGVVTINMPPTLTNTPTFTQTPTRTLVPTNTLTPQKTNTGSAATATNPVPTDHLETPSYSQSATAINIPGTPVPIIVTENLPAFQGESTLSINSIDSNTQVFGGIKNNTKESQNQSESVDYLSTSESTPANGDNDDFAKLNRLLWTATGFLVVILLAMLILHQKLRN